MGKRKIKKFLALALAIGMLSSTSITTAFASDLSGSKSTEITSTAEKNTNLTEKDKKNLDNWMKKNGVQDNTRKFLLGKLENGQLWDSLTSSSPIKTEKLDKNTTKNTYADGSIAVTTIEEPTTSIGDGEVTTQSIRPGWVTSGSGYISYKGSIISESVGLITARFSADYTYVNGGDDYIDSAFDEKVTGYGVSISEVSLNVDRPTEGNGHYATATLKFVADFLGYGGSSCYLKLLVGNDSADTEYSW